MEASVWFLIEAVRLGGIHGHVSVVPSNGAGRFNGETTPPKTQTTRLGPDLPHSHTPTKKSSMRIQALLLRALVKKCSSYSLLTST